MHELAARLARGEEAAFAELYDACADRLHHYVAARLGSRDAASDVVQSAFLRAVKSRRRFRGVENPVAYMFQIARNEAARLARSGRPATTLANLAEPFTERRMTVTTPKRSPPPSRGSNRRSGISGTESVCWPDVSRDRGDRRPSAGNCRHPLPPRPRIAARLADQRVSLT